MAQVLGFLPFMGETWAIFLAPHLGPWGRKLGSVGASSGCFRHLGIQPVCGGLLSLLLTCIHTLTLLTVS